MPPRSITVKQACVSARGLRTQAIDRATVLRYAARVAQGPIVEIPEARADAIQLRTLVPLGIACACAGLALAFSLTRVTDARAATPPTAQEEDVTRPVEHEPPAAVMTQRPMRRPDAAIATVERVASEPPPSRVRDPRPDASVAEQELAPRASARPEREQREPWQPKPWQPKSKQPEPTAGVLKVQPGLIAYLRCDGLAAQRGPFPCPRDRPLEQRLRAIVEALPQCTEASAIGRGAFELRAELHRAGSVTKLDIRGPNADLERAVRACMGRPVEALRTTLKPERMILSLRFATR